MPYCGSKGLCRPSVLRNLSVKDVCDETSSSPARAADKVPHKASAAAAPQSATRNDPIRRLLRPSIRRPIVQFCGMPSPDVPASKADALMRWITQTHAQRQFYTRDQGAFTAPPPKRDSYNNPITPATIAPSARLNTYQRKENPAVSTWNSTKSITPGQCRPSMPLPTAPPMISPRAAAVSRDGARVSQTQRNITAA